MVGLSPVRGSIYFGSLLGLISFIAIAPFPFRLLVSNASQPAAASLSFSASWSEKYRISLQFNSPPTWKWNVRCILSVYS